MNVGRLDGASFESLMASFTALWNVTSAELEAALLVRPLWQIWDESELKVPQSGDSAILNHIKKLLGIQENHSAFSEMIWFHITRVSRDTTFEDGLLPTRRNIERIWSFVGKCAAGVLTERELTSLRQGHEGLDREMYRQKLNNDGPFALNLKESAFRNEELGNNDFFKIPEILQDIVKPLESQIALDLLSRFQAASEPCIVTFVDSTVTRNMVTSALHYLDAKLRNEELGYQCNTCYDGHGIAVPAERILSVEFPFLK